VSWSIVYMKQAQKDAKKIAASGLKSQTERLIEILEKDPFQTPPPFERLLGDLAGEYCRRISILHRLVYQVYAKQRTVKVLRMWTQYE
jgi:toxin YoeB